MSLAVLFDDREKVAVEVSQDLETLASGIGRACLVVIGMTVGNAS